MNRGQKNRNPGNLRFAGQREATSEDDKGFAVFPSDPAGWRALVNQIKLDQGRGLNFEQFVIKYAPPVENMTARYIAVLTTGLACESGDLLVSFSPYAIAGLIAVHEGYFDSGV
jgi:hypothetical protein